MRKKDWKEGAQAAAFYQKPFGAKLVAENFNEDIVSYAHAELDVYGQIAAVAEAQEGETSTGNTMRFCLHFGPGNEALIQRAYDALSEGGRVMVPLGPCEYSPLMADLIDTYGIRWCIFL